MFCGRRKFCDNHWAWQFLINCIMDMLTNCFGISPEQISHLKSLADLADLRRRTTKKRPNRNNLITISNCLSLRDNAACCIPLRDLRYLRENNTQEYSIYCTKKPQCVSRRFTQTKTVWVNESCGELIINWNSRSHIYVLQVWASKRPFNNM